jgi:hypothetical protein
MSLGLTLTAPPDLSVGRVRLVQGAKQVGDWVASPTEMQHRFESLDTGLYQAVAEPLGQPSRSFIFVLSERDNQVAMPTLQAMSSPDFALSNFQAVVGPLVQSVVGTVVGSVVERVASGLQQVVNPAVKAFLESNTAEPLTLGLSQYTSFEKETARPYSMGQTPEVTLAEGALEVVLHRPDGALGRDSFAVVLTCAVGGARDISLRLPLFSGGVRIACAASALGTADLSYRVIPVDRNRRAITQALFAGSSMEAAPVIKTLSNGSEAVLGVDDWQDDPWTAVAVALLYLRFPNLAPDELSVDPALLSERFPWLADVHVLEAFKRLRQAARLEPSGPERKAVLVGVLQCLVRGRDAGPPYFAYSEQLAGEMLAALASDGTLAEGAGSQLTGQRRRPSAPRNVGAVYAWLGTDLPSKTGAIDPRSATVIVSARVHQDRITLDTKDLPSVSASLAHIAAPLVAAMAAPFRTVRGTTEPIRDKVLWGEALQGLRDLAAVGAAALRGAISKRGDVPAQPDKGDMLSGPPALGRSVTDADDPHKGRFGGEASRNGFTLSARFAGGEEANPVEITLAVLCEKDLESYDDVVEFFLHPTFRPSRLPSLSGDRGQWSRS